VAQAQEADHGSSFAVNRAAKLAYKQTGDGDREPVALVEVPRDGLTRTGHARIGDRWFSVYAAGER
jgi:hypothetical protein